MKKIFSILLTALAVSALAPAVSGQGTQTYPKWSIKDQIKDPKYPDQEGHIIDFPNDTGLRIDTEKKVAYSKNVSSPFSDGTYWIKLETFATGNATYKMQSQPADIVLVLDYSGSMYQYYGPAGYHYDVVAPSAGFAYSNGFWTATAATDQRFYKTNGQYYKVERGSVPTGGTYVDGSGTERDEYYQFLYYEVNGTKYYLDDMNVVTVMPTKYTNQDNNAIIWKGSLYQYKNFTNTTADNNNNANRWSRIRELRSAVADFIDVIYHNDLYEDDGFDKPRPTKLGNRISIVTFSGSTASIVNSSVNGGWIPVTNDAGCRDETLLKAIASTNPSSNTPSDQGMTSANTQLGKIASDRESSRTVLLFTDGVPGAATNWSDNTCYPVAIRCIRQAYIAKKTYKANVYSVSIWAGDYTTGNGPKMKQYLEYTSSNYPDANPPTGQNAFTEIGEKCDSENRPESQRKPAIYFKTPTEDLSSVFTEIARQSGGDSNTSLSSATSNVDIISNSFILPDELSQSGTVVTDYIKVFTAKLLTMNNGDYVFDDELLVDHSEDQYYTYDENGIQTGGPFDVDENIRPVLVNDEVTGKPIGVKVVGFDYSSNWCGPIEDEVEHTTRYQGHKIIIMIPIKMNPEAVGGPNVQTNEEGSGIYVNDTATKPLIPFVSPTVSLPVNIYIEKTGIEGVESAKFLIERAVLPALPEGQDEYTLQDIQGIPEANWKYVTTVFVTNSDNAQHDADSGNPVVRVKGLPATEAVSGVQKGLVYRISEETWSWAYKPLGSKYQYTVTGQVNNPFTFENENKNTAVKHAESKVTNIFMTGTTKVYDDSKDNGR